MTGCDTGVRYPKRGPMNITDETKQRNWKAARRMFKLADELGFPDHSIAELMGKRSVTIAAWRDGNRGGTPMPLEKIEQVIRLLRDRKAAKLAEQGNGVPETPVKADLSQSAVEMLRSSGGAGDWRDGYAVGFEAGVRYAERKAEVKA